MWTQITLALVLLALAADVITTVIVIGQGGHEDNPAMRWLMSKIGMWPGLLLTHIPAAVFFALVGLWWGNVMGALAFGAAAFHNVGQIRGRR